MAAMCMGAAAAADDGKRKKAVINFALGFVPAAHLMSYKMLSGALSKVAESSSDGFELMLQYTDDCRGDTGLLVDLAKWLDCQYVGARSCIASCPQDQFQGQHLTLASGVSQCMQVALNTLIEPGVRDIVLIENPSFFACTGIVRNNHGFLLPVPGDMENGIDLEALSKLLATPMAEAFPDMAAAGGAGGGAMLVRERVAAMYVIPDHHNPCAYHMSLKARCRLIELAHEHDIAIVADEVYSLLSFDDAQRYPFLSSLEQRLLVMSTDADADAETVKFEGGGVDGKEEVVVEMRAVAAGQEARVISMSSMSKIIGGAFRVGFMHTRNDKWLEAFEHYGAFFSGCNAAHFHSMLLRPFLRAGGVAAGDGDGEVTAELDAHIEMVRADLKAKAAMLTTALKKWDPESLCSFVEPSGGYFVMLRTPVLSDAVLKVLADADDEHELVLLPGSVCSTQCNPFCKTFGQADDAKIEESANPNDQVLRHSFRLCFAGIKDAESCDIGVAMLMKAVYAVYKCS